MGKDIAIKVDNVSKHFRVPHRKIDSFRNAFVNIFAPNNYENFEALKDISFEVKKGEFLGIIGHNGAGKSTLLKILASVYQPTNGNIEVNGMISPFLELGIGFNPELSGRDNIYLNATVLGLTKKQIDRKFNEIVAFAELEEFIDQQIKNYSSGMKARLAFSVSIHANRDILLMDEVLAVGDSAFQEKCLSIFKDYKKNDRTVILVTHSISTVREYCDRALLLDKGKILDMGNVDDVCDAYMIRNMKSKSSGYVNESEGKKIESEEKIKSRIRSRIKDKPQSIVDINVKNNNGKELLTTTRGEDFSIEVEVHIKELIDNLDLAVQLIDKYNNVTIAGNNTYIDNFDCSWKKGANVIKLEVKNHSLNEGNFYIKTLLFKNRNERNLTVDEFNTLEKNVFFTVKRKDSGGGFVYINHEWKKNDEK